MKISRIPGCGSFGVFIDDVNFETITEEEWIEIGKIHLKELVTIIRGANIKRDVFYTFMKKWGKDRLNWAAMLFLKYPWANGDVDCIRNSPIVEQSDKDLIEEFVRVRIGGHRELGNILKVTGKKDKDGKRLGMFAEGELLWHSNESGDIAFTPGVALLAAQGTTKSSTGFMTTTDYYYKVSDSFRSEMDEMVLVHNFTPGKINPGLNDDQDNLMYKNMCPDPNTEIPLVIKSPGGIKGLHYSFNTVTGIKDMNSEDASSVLREIRKGLNTPDYSYDHWYQNDGDLVLFDNSITQHRRQGVTKDRVCFRYCYDYTYLQDAPYMPYSQQPYVDSYISRINNIIETLDHEEKDFLLPTDKYNYGTLKNND